jgi:REP element-mobilizing transposase RayT
MARKVRLEYAGALYHVINRGNYRQDIFAEDGARLSFEKAIFEACTKARWRLHAFVIMSNHYHLALETPEPNLVAGMQWLQSICESFQPVSPRERARISRPLQGHRGGG